jgi:hypothetical protein
MSVVYCPERLLRDETQIQRENEKSDLNEEGKRKKEGERETKELLRRELKV